MNLADVVEYLRTTNSTTNVADLCESGVGFDIRDEDTAFDANGELRGYWVRTDDEPEPAPEPDPNDEPEEELINRYFTTSEGLVHSQADAADLEGRNFQENVDKDWKAQLYTPPRHLNEDFSKYKYFALERQRRVRKYKAHMRQLAIKVKLARKHKRTADLKTIKLVIVLAERAMNRRYREGVAMSLATKEPQWWKLHLTKAQTTELKMWFARLKSL